MVEYGENMMSVNEINESAVVDAQTNVQYARCIFCHKRQPFSEVWGKWEFATPDLKELEEWVDRFGEVQAICLNCPTEDNFFPHVRCERYYYHK